MTKRDTLIQLAGAAASEADAIEVDSINAETEDDVMAILSHIEILQRMARQLQDAARARLEELSGT